MDAVIAVPERYPRIENQTRCNATSLTNGDGVSSSMCTHARDAPSACSVVQHRTHPHGTSVRTRPDCRAIQRWHRCGRHFADTQRSSHCRDTPHPCPTRPAGALRARSSATFDVPRSAGRAQPVALSRSRPTRRDRLATSSLPCPARRVQSTASSRRRRHTGLATCARQIAGDADRLDRPRACQISVAPISPRTRGRALSTSSSRRAVCR